MERIPTAPVLVRSVTSAKQELEQRRKSTKTVRHNRGCMERIPTASIVVRSVTPGKQELEERREKNLKDCSSQWRVRGENSYCLSPCP